MSHRTLKHYEILEKLGEGGMGVLYRAVDTRLDRPVALKLLPPHLGADRERRERLAQEARAASALNHPNIVTIYEIDQAPAPTGGSGEVDFIAMEFIDGGSLQSRIPDGGMPLEQAVGWAVEAASAVAAAHRAGIVHRDLKPANLMINAAGHLKVLDFGLAKLAFASDAAEAEEPTLASPVMTQEGATLGTPVYMSPEQAMGRAVDARTDVYSLGLVIYEMLAGRRPFADETPVARLAGPAPSVRAARPEVPEELARIVDRCLETDPAERYPSAAELELDLREVASRLAARPLDLAALAKRPGLVAVAGLVLVVLVGSAWWLWRRGAGERWARSVALPEIERLLEEEDLSGAYRLAREAERRVPGDAQLERLWERFTFPVSIRSEPPGARVFAKLYLAAVDEPWEDLGRTPIEGARLPHQLHRYRFEKEGYETVEVAPAASLGDAEAFVEASLWPIDTAPPGMVRIPAGPGHRFLRVDTALELGPFWIDRHEVTNRQFQEFVDAGGYQKPELWRHPFVEDGEAVAREEAMNRFEDRTGRPGPAGWELGRFPEGEGDLPVGGVSWYEATAYAEWAGKSLPTIHHWFRAANPSFRSEILLASNFAGVGPDPVGHWPGVGPYGTLDMAGNVKEWSLTAAGGKRYLLGGSWRDATYLYLATEADSPFAREPINGFRCALYPEPLPPAQTEPLEIPVPDYRALEPVSDEVFAALASFYAYDETPLDARVESVDDSPPDWRVEEVSFAAAYGGERVPAFLFVPKNAEPPYQTVVYFPTSLAETLASSEHLELRWFDYVVRSGRAVLHPIYKGTFERRVEGSSSVASIRRDVVIQWSKDLGRSLDYLETRPEFDPDRIAYYGFSLGAVYGPMLVAMEERLRAAVLLGGGFTGYRLPPEVDAVNFLPRVEVPFLMITGRDDFLRPIELAQRPFLERLGTAPEHKRLAILEGGHAPVSMHGVMRETLDWLDRYLGPVGQERSVAAD